MSASCGQGVRKNSTHAFAQPVFMILIQAVGLFVHQEHTQVLAKVRETSALAGRIVVTKPCIAQPSDCKIV